MVAAVPSQTLLTVKFASAGVENCICVMAGIGRVRGEHPRKRRVSNSPTFAAREDRCLHRVGSGAVAGDFSDDEIRRVGRQPAGRDVLPAGVGLADDRKLLREPAEQEVELVSACRVEELQRERAVYDALRRRRSRVLAHRGT